VGLRLGSRGERVRRRQQTLLQRLRGEKIGIQRERRGNFFQCAFAVAGLDESASGVQSRLKSLPPFSLVHVRPDSKMSSLQPLGWTRAGSTGADSGCRERRCGYSGFQFL
jgi:hypothetical protein